MIAPQLAFNPHFVQTIRYTFSNLTMSATTTTQSNSKRKQSNSLTLAPSTPKPFHNKSPHHASSHSDENNHTSGSKHHKFSYPETRKPTKPENALLPAPIPHPSSSNIHYVFVYGTLKKGFPNSHLLYRATFIGEFRTITRYPLVIGGKYNSPYLLDMPSQGSRVKGELYAVDEAMLADLDYLENVGVNYTRRVAKISHCADRSFIAKAHVYFKTNALETLSKKEYLDDYQCRRYVPRHLRPKEGVESAGVAVAAGR